MLRRFLLATALIASPVAMAADKTPWLHVSANGHFLGAGGKPFFWLGDTGWLMLGRLNREETERYLAKRAAQGFNVIQVMVLHSPAMTNRYDAPALENGDPSGPRTTPGADPAKPGEYDYWDHLDWTVDRAAARGIYLALVPSWGSLADAGKLTPETAAAYGRFLAERYHDKPNIVWLNGGDTPGDKNTATWQALGTAIKAVDRRHLMTFHPFGRTDSSWTFHQAAWLDFNMFQSGHRSYAQEEPGARSEDNWRFVAEDWARTPAKPTIDGEPSYETIPRGLHDVTQPRWGADDVRRYAWWAVFAGAFGHTYGENSVMQMYVPGRDKPAYGAELRWDVALDAPGAGQMRHLKTLMLSRPFFERVPDQSLILDNGERYERVLATRGRDYAMAYSYTGKPFRIRLGVIAGKRVRAAWYSPRTGETRAIGVFANAGERRFTPPGTPRPGNDWVLLLDDAAAKRRP
ncbi:glycoside hydrolase family 140 protein [Sphingomonas sp. DT-204]|uniref:glycoside hydrolase family 140 protein n=1 Tax=Sphingomonas sp. DT-204 TaxID=3396166 RepID=UPI003F1D5EBB